MTDPLLERAKKVFSNQYTPGDDVITDKDIEHDINLIHQSLLDVKRETREEDVAICEDYETRANLKGMHVQYDTARFLANAIKNQDAPTKEREPVDES